ncbi:MAG TPA: efflux RND transporter periplasmic adaptor subunit [Opitutaceae bacterium]|nr:efflux RND transporter periplasmic adaptor subunit [Opitutaceae bacterium]
MSVAAAAVVAGLVATAALHTTARAASDAPAAAPAAAKVTVAAVEQRLLADTDEITGHVDALETVELRARVSGHLDAVNFQSGQIVRKGDLLFSIDPRWYQAQFDLASARSDVASHEAKRADELLAVHAISIEEAESRRAKSAEAAAELTTARLDLEHTQVRAPITGRIARALVTTGNLVSGQPGDATLLTTIVSVGDAYVYADMDESTFLRFSRLARGNPSNARIPVELELADETGFPRHGFIESSDNRLNPSTGSLTLRMVFPNADGSLIPGLYARVRVPVSAPEPTLLISERAVETDQGQKFVLVVGSDKVASYRTVTLGETVEGKRVIKDGLKQGDLVIVNGLQRVRPGMPVDPDVEVAALPIANAVAVR